MKDAVLYIHGMGGSAAEGAHYAPLFPESEVIGLAYSGNTPWDAGKEIFEAVSRLQESYGGVTLIANSVGAYFSMNAGIDAMLRRAFFISPVVDMEKLICGLMARANVTEERLRAAGRIPLPGGEALSWEYLRFTRARPISWKAPTCILYGENDGLIPRETVESFASAHGAALTVMPQGEHWFHTAEQMRFLDDWLRNAANR